MHKSAAQLAIAFAFAALWGAPAISYIGPGAGITVLGALWGVIVAIAVAIGAIVLWPFRVLLRRRRKRASSNADEAPAGNGEAPGSEPRRDRELSPEKRS